ncbi:hypothetical protein [Haladaptatus sp. DFWS20]
MSCSTCRKSLKTHNDPAKPSRFVHVWDVVASEKYCEQESSSPDHISI